MIIGVLGIQGNLEEHEKAARLALESLGKKGEVIRVRDIKSLSKTDCLIISGGESTTMWKLLKKDGLWEGLKAYEKPILGTCAGMILLSKEGSGRDSKKSGQEFLGKIDAVVNRNAFGRQKESFEAEVDFCGKKIPGVFIRAPCLESVGDGVEVLSKDKGGRILAARDKKSNVMVTAFHPELTGDLEVLRVFLGN